MPIVCIFPSEEFRRQVKRLMKKHKTLLADLAKLQQLLLKDPCAGTDLGGGKHKIRLKVAAKNKGKSGGYRVITYHVIKTEEVVYVYLVTLYDKAEYSSISDKYIDQIIREL